MFGSRWLIDQLARLGFSVSYEEVQRCKQPSVDFKMKPLLQLQQRRHTLQKGVTSDLLWQCGWLLQSHQIRNPNWSGFMQNLSVNDSVPEKSAIHLLLLIDLNLSDKSCIYSTLRFIDEQALRLRIPTPCVAFDHGYRADLNEKADDQDNLTFLTKHFEVI